MRVPLAGGERSSHALWLRVPQSHYQQQQQQQSSTAGSRRPTVEVALVFYYRTSPSGEPRVLVHRFELELLPSLNLHALVSRSPLPSTAASASSTSNHSLPPENDLRIQLQLTNPHPENFPVIVRVLYCTYFYIFNMSM